MGLLLVLFPLVTKQGGSQVLSVFGGTGLEVRRSVEDKIELLVGEIYRGSPFPCTLYLLPAPLPPIRPRLLRTSPAPLISILPGQKGSHLHLPILSAASNETHF